MVPVEVGMMTLTCRVTEANGDQIDLWIKVNQAIMSNLPEDLKHKWSSSGYEVLFSTVPEYFGMTRMYRNKDSYVTFEFTDQEWTMFILRWL